MKLKLVVMCGVLMMIGGCHAHKWKLMETYEDRVDLICNCGKTWILEKNPQ